jgi:arabinosaccharide transport system substrate-binding protein
MNKRDSIARRAFLRRTLLGAGAVALPTLVTACSGSTPTTSDSASPGAAATAPAAQTTKTITFWYNAENHRTEYDARVDEINKKYNIDFKLELLSGDTQVKKLQATLMSGSGFPDIIEMNANQFVGFMKGDDNIVPFARLNEVLEAGPYYKQVLESRWKRYTKDGVIYGAPHDVHPMLALYNDAAWKEFGVDLSSVVTWDDLLAVVEKVDPKMPDGSTRYPIMDGYSLQARMMEKGVWWTNEKGESMLTDPRFKEAVVDWLRFVPYTAEIDWTNQVSMLKSGQVLTTFAPDWLYGIHKQGTQDDTTFLANSPMRLMRVPDFSPNGPRVGTAGGAAAGVPKLSPNRDLAIEIMQYLYFDNSQGQLEERYKTTGILPPVTSAWGDAGFHEADPYVGGQKSGELFIEAAKAMPGFSENWTTIQVASAWFEQEGPLRQNAVSLDDAIANAEKTAQDNLEKNAL